MPAMPNSRLVSPRSRQDSRPTQDTSRTSVPADEMEQRRAMRPALCNGPRPAGEFEARECLTSLSGALGNGIAQGSKVQGLGKGLKPSNA